MRFCLTFCIAIVTLAATAQKATQSQVLVVTENISYSCELKVYNNEVMSALVLVDPASVDVFFENSMDYVKKPESKGIYDYAPKTLNLQYHIPGKYVETEFIFDFEEGIDTVTLLRNFPPYDSYDTVIVRKINPAMLRFSERWILNEEAGIFIKEIQGYCPVSAEFSSNNELMGYRPLFWLWTDKLPASKGKDIVFPDDVIYDVGIRSYVVMCDDEYEDENMSKYESIETMYNYDNIEASRRLEFVLTILRNVYEGTMTAWNNNGEKISLEDLQNLLLIQKEEEVAVFDDETWEEKSMVLMTEYPLEPQYFSRLRFREEWSYNPASMRFTKKVKAIGFIYYPNDDIYPGFFQSDIEPVFWVHF